MPFSHGIAVSESTEVLRETLLSLRQEYETLKQSNAHAAQLLDSLESLLAVTGDEDPFASVFASLRKVFVFSHVFMLAETVEPTSDHLACIFSELPEVLDSRWKVSSLFRKVMAGKVIVTFSGVGVEEWETSPFTHLHHDCSVLYVPVRVHDKRGIVLLLRDKTMPGFDRSHISLAQRFSVLVSHALATQYARQSEAESKRLRELGMQLRRSEQVAQRNADLLNQIVSAMPVGVVVQGADTQLHMINHAAREVFGPTAEKLSTIYEAELPIQKGDIDGSREVVVTLADGTSRTMLLTATSVKIFQEQLLLTTSLDITERKQVEQTLHHRAFHDQLTGLPNRTSIDVAVNQAIARHSRGGMFALAFIDLDNFKQVNDYYSHALGDQLLISVAARINDVIRAQDTLARISGDEFILLIDHIHSGDEVAPILNRIAMEIKQPFLLEGRELFISASIGVSIFPFHGTDYESLRRCADNAMYRAKSQHKGSVAYFETSMSSALTARMDVEQQLRAAIRDKRFRNVYQPKVQIEHQAPEAHHAVKGVEALVRWVDPDGTIHMPGVFIPVANELGLIDEITFFVLGQIVRDLPLLMACYGEQISVSLNVSARQVGDFNFMATLMEKIAATHVASYLMLELTEEALLDASRFQGEVLPQLKAMGIRVAIDDFGTGYSSLSTLADITIDELKVDRAFISGIHEKPRNQGILRAIESICSVLNISIVAEGVEQQEELDYLRQRTAIQQVQGFYFGRPEFPERLQSLQAIQ